MQIVKVVAGIGIGLMLAAIGYGFALGNFAQEGAQLLAMPWGVVSLVDLFTGFSLFALWMAYRERRWPNIIIWWVLLIVLGNLTSAIYVFWAAHTSGGDWRKFFMGERA